MNDRALQRVIAPQRETVAIGVEQIGQRLEFVPLFLVVPGLPPARIGPLARGLDLDEADQRFVNFHREVWPGPQLGQ